VSLRFFENRLISVNMALLKEKKEKKREKRREKKQWCYID